MAQENPPKDATLSVEAMTGVKLELSEKIRAEVLNKMTFQFMKILMSKGAKASMTSLQVIISYVSNSPHITSIDTKVAENTLATFRMFMLFPCNKQRMTYYADHSSNVSQKMITINLMQYFYLTALDSHTILKPIVMNKKGKIVSKNILTRLINLREWIRLKKILSGEISWETDDTFSEGKSWADAVKETWEETIKTYNSTAPTKDHITLEEYETYTNAYHAESYLCHQILAGFTTLGVSSVSDGGLSRSEIFSAFWQAFHHDCAKSGTSACIQLRTESGPKYFSGNPCHGRVGSLIMTSLLTINHGKTLAGSSDTTAARAALACDSMCTRDHMCAGYHSSVLENVEFEKLRIMFMSRHDNYTKFLTRMLATGDTFGKINEKKNEKNAHIKKMKMWNSLVDSSIEDIVEQYVTVFGGVSNGMIIGMAGMSRATKSTLLRTVVMPHLYTLGYTEEEVVNVIRDEIMVYCVWLYIRNKLEEDSVRGKKKTTYQALKDDLEAEAYSDSKTDTYDPIMFAPSGKLYSRAYNVYKSEKLNKSSDATVSVNRVMSNMVWEGILSGQVIIVDTLAWYNGISGMMPGSTVSDRAVVLAQTPKFIIDCKSNLPLTDAMAEERGVPMQSLLNNMVQAITLTRPWPIAMGAYENKGMTELKPAFAATSNYNVTQVLPPFRDFRAAAHRMKSTVSASLVTQADGTISGYEEFKMTLDFMSKFHKVVLATASDITLVPNMDSLEIMQHVLEQYSRAMSLEERNSTDADDEANARALCKWANDNILGITYRYRLSFDAVLSSNPHIVRVRMNYNNGSPFWGTWGRSNRGTLYFLDLETYHVEIDATALQRGRENNAKFLDEALREEGIDADDVVENSSSSHRFDAVQVATKELLDRINVTNKVDHATICLSAKADGSMLRCILRRRNTKYNEMLYTSLITGESEFAKVAAKTFNDMTGGNWFLEVRSQNAAISDHMGDYYVHSILVGLEVYTEDEINDISDSGETWKTLAPVALKILSVKLISLLEMLPEDIDRTKTISFIFESIVKDRMTAWGTLHFELVRSYSWSNIVLLGVIGYNDDSPVEGTYYPHFEIDVEIVASGFMQPLYWMFNKNSSTRDIRELPTLFQDMTKVLEGEMKADDYIAAHPSNNTKILGNYSSLDLLDFEGFVGFINVKELEVIGRQPWDYFKMKTKDYYIGHQEGAVEKQLDIATRIINVMGDTSAPLFTAFPIFLIVYKFVTGSEEKMANMHAAITGVITNAIEQLVACNETHEMGSVTNPLVTALKGAPHWEDGATRGPMTGATKRAALLSDSTTTYERKKQIIRDLKGLLIKNAQKYPWHELLCKYYDIAIPTPEIAEKLKIKISVHSTAENLALSLARMDASAISSDLVNSTSDIRKFCARIYYLMKMAPRIRRFEGI
jgi:hypothetical protein